MRTFALVLGLVSLLLAACGSDDAAPDGPPGAGTGDGPQEIEVTGYLLRSGGETRICEALAESYPPQCGGTSYRVTGLDFSGVAGLQEAQAVTWSESQVTLRGVLSADGETLMLSANPVQRGGPPPPTVAGQPGYGPG